MQNFLSPPAKRFGETIGLCLSKLRLAYSADLDEGQASLEFMFQSGMLIKRRGERKRLKCKTCDREAAEREFCLVHLRAYQNLVEKYDCWRKALNISWREYLSEIERNPLTGEWVKEVVNYLVNNEGIRSAKES